MGLVPLLSSIGRNKAGAALISLQIALTLAVLCNALFIIERQTALSRAPSGVADESNVYVVSNQWAIRSEDLAAREQADLADLRALPQVVDATLSPVHPFGGRGLGMAITIDPGRPHSGSGTAIYPMDDHALATLGLRLIAGRNFHPEEIGTVQGATDHLASWGSVIITRGLALQLDPGGNVLGRTASIAPGNMTATIVGIVDKLGPSEDARSTMGANAILAPLLWVDQDYFYLVRAKPGQLVAAMQATRNVLYRSSRQRTIVGMQSMAEARGDRYRGAHGMTVLLGIICSILLGVTALGIFGLTSYWVSQRRRQIGVRRALGATAADIRHSFQVENLLISGAGSTLGILLALAANLWVLRSLSSDRLPAGYLLAGAVTVLILGQLAVLWPAIRASAVPPAIAARGA